MANYKAVAGKDVATGNDVWFVTFADGPNIGTRQSLSGYKNEESAKRRIRDLKRKEKPSVEKIAASSAYGKSKPFTVAPAEYGTITKPVIHNFEIRETLPRGVYPAVSKHSYRR